MPGIIVQDYLSPCKLIWRKKYASMNFRGDEMQNLISVLNNLGDGLYAHWFRISFITLSKTHEGLIEWFYDFIKHLLSALWFDFEIVFSFIPSSTLSPAQVPYGWPFEEVETQNLGNFGYQCKMVEYWVNDGDKIIGDFGHHNLCILLISINTVKYSMMDATHSL